jgi:hypothetical protein
VIQLRQRSTGRLLRRLVSEGGRSRLRERDWASFVRLGPARKPVLRGHHEADLGLLRWAARVTVAPN